MQPGHGTAAATAHDAYAEVNGVRLHYVEEGKGPLILFLHGFPEFWYAWKDLLPEFAKDHRAVAVDMRGYNLSSMPEAVDAYQVPILVEDVRALAELWNRQHRPTVDADDLLSQTASPGVVRYCKVHNDNLMGATPYAQIAIEYEIEMLPLRFGEAFVARCVELLGPDILSCLSFVTSHIRLDVAHTKSNAWAMAEVSKIPGSLPVLAAWWR